MFICDNHMQSVGPNISPIMHVAVSRPKVYMKGDKQIGTGTEIVREMKLCRKCAGLPPEPEREQPDLNYLRQVAKINHDHARFCNGTTTVKRGGEKITEPCRICQHNMEWFASLTPAILSLVLQESIVR